MAALASPLQAEVVFTPAHQEVGKNGVTLDFNHDGIPDTRFQAREFSSDSWGIIVFSAGANRVLSVGSRRQFVSDLGAGYRVGPNSQKFKTGHSFSSYKGPAKLMYLCNDSSGIVSCSGPWDKNTAGSYVGFQFSIQGETHYGWARLKVNIKQPNNQFHVFLTGYAYETIPNKPIVTGKTSGPSDRSVKQSEIPSATLGMLSAGTTALPLRRLPVQ